MGWIVGDPAAVLVVEFSGDQPSALKDAVRQIGDVLTIAESKEEQARVWNVRKMGLGILDSRPYVARPVAFIEDCAIPVEELSAFVREVERIMSTHGTEGGIYAHASAGCLHIRPVLNLQKGEGVRALRSIGEQVFALTASLGGSMSSEHGDGIVTGEWIEKTYGKKVTDAMRLLKRAADPENLLNPNKMFDAPPMDTHLRFGEDYQTQTWIPSLHFDHERGLAGAIEHCNGQGVCLKSNGVMCPSYQATREESNSTRGRANLLRGLISSPMSLRGGRSSRRRVPFRVSNRQFDEEIASSFTSFSPRNDMIEATAKALDLCLACKGCKAECPSGVDMAKLKYEFENEYYKTHRRPLRDYVFGYFHVAAKLASSVASFSNAMMQIPLFKNILARLLGVTTKRPFPKFTRQRAKLLASEMQNHKQRIIFLSDPFARYIEPQVEQAAFDVLSACGYDVRVLPIIGAGASLFSKGFIDAAKRHAGKVLDALKQIDPESDAVIVGIEPPEIYTLKHDYLDLLPDRADEIASVSARTWLLDEYLLRSDSFSSLRVGTLGSIDEFDIGNQRIKFQPHCHQRAEGLSSDGFPNGVNATVELLHSCGYNVDLLDTGCCGMAGTFGYEAEHYELSMQVGALKLFPEIKDHSENEDLVVASTGAACRMQIQQGTGVNAAHPIVLVRDALLNVVSRKNMSN